LTGARGSGLLRGSMTHRRAVLVLVLVTLLWSIAGVVTRQLESARSFEITFWRSAFTALALAGLLGAWVGPGGLVRTIRGGGRLLWLSGLAWGVMFTAFMLALTLTTVANVLVTMALAPLLSALFARVALGYRVPLRTGLAGLVAGLGIAWMVSSELGHSGGRHLAGTLVALSVPVAAAANWTLLQGAVRTERAAASDMRPAILLGALFSAAATLPLALPFQASPQDLAWLALLGVVQLAIPCLLAVAASRVLSAPEVALITLLEVLFGVAWAWLGAGERPAGSVLAGGALVLLALVANEAHALRSR
jgi:drug/metabolite transporter (DMT)-like permease